MRIRRGGVTSWSVSVSSCGCGGRHEEGEEEVELVSGRKGKGAVHGAGSPKADIHCQPTTAEGEDQLAREAESPV